MSEGNKISVNASCTTTLEGITRFIARQQQVESQYTGLLDSTQLFYNRLKRFCKCSQACSPQFICVNVLYHYLTNIECEDDEAEVCPPTSDVFFPLVIDDDYCNSINMETHTRKMNVLSSKNHLIKDIVAKVLQLAMERNRDGI